MRSAARIARSGATVVPIVLGGHKSRLFRVASHLRSTLRLGLLPGEFRRCVGTSVRIVAGEPIPPRRSPPSGPTPRR